MGNLGISETGHQCECSDHRDFAVSKNATKRVKMRPPNPYFVACNWAMMATVQGQNRSQGHDSTHAAFFFLLYYSNKQLLTFLIQTAQTAVLDLNAHI